MTYSPEAIAEIEGAFATLSQLKTEVIDSYVSHPFNNASAREFAHHGLARRIGVLFQCIDNVFTLIPPVQTEPVTKERRNSAEINIHAFVIGVFGSMDNLARIWTLENGVMNKKGQPLKDPQIGLTPDHEIVRASLRPCTLNYLNSLGDWFAYLIGFRHSLAHRVPLYIPPYIVPEKNVTRYNEIQEARHQAFLEQDFAKVEALDREQSMLTPFRAWIARSPNEEPRPVGFHSQMIADFRTVHDVAMRLMEDFRAP